MTRRVLLGVAALVLWAGVLGWHVRREYFVPELERLAEATLSLAPGTNYFLLEMGGEPVGTGSSRLDTLPDGFQLEDLMILELDAMGRSGQVVLNTQVGLTRALRMRSFSFRLQTADATYEAEGELEGDSVLRVRGPEELRIPVDEPPISAAALPLLVAHSGEMRVGRTLRVPVFDPSTLSTRPVEVEILEVGTVAVTDSAVYDDANERWRPGPEREIAAWRVRESFAGMTTESWIDADGRVLRASSPLGFTLQRASYELARQARDDRSADGPDIVFGTAISSNRGPDELEGVQQLRVRLGGIEPDRFDLDGGRQVWSGDTLQVTRETLDDLAPGYRLPFGGEGLGEALAPEPLIQSDDPRIRAAAEEALEGTTDPVDAALRLNDAVFRRLDKRITLALPSAVAALEDGVGDCMEHTTLYLAMARSVGLPARAAVGLVHLDGRFFYHAWPEVWLGEWVAMEPTFGQAPAGATHLRFITGSLARQIEVAGLIGSLEIEVLDDRR